MLFAPGTQAHHDWLIEHLRQVNAGEAPVPPLSVAEHESAHAVMAVLAGASFGEVVMLPERDWRSGHAAGWAEVRVTGATPEDTLLRGLTILWAGALMDGHLCHSGPDMALVAAATARLPESRQGMPFTAAAQRVTGLRPVILTVASRLAVAGRLTQAEVVQAMRSASSPN